MMASHLPKSRVAILLCTWNGSRFLGEQLDSIQAQTYRNWKIWASDDGGTIESLLQYQVAMGSESMSIRRGPGKGFCANFLHLACDCSIDADYFAFCDQDDVWDENKLERAIRWIGTVPSSIPALYCGRSRLIDESSCVIGLSPLFSRPPGLRNALVQSIGGGNTMMFNRAARLLLIEAGESVSVQTHDWWLYLLVAGCGGVVHYDPEPMISYRQHEKNQVGAKMGLWSGASRIKQMIIGGFRMTNDRHLMALERVLDRFTIDNRQIVLSFRKVRELGLTGRVWGFWRGRYYRQTVAGDLGLFIAALLKRV